MAMSRGELKQPSSMTLEEMGQKLAQLKVETKLVQEMKPTVVPVVPLTGPAAAVRIIAFHGIIYEEVEDDDVVEKDGGGLSKIKNKIRPSPPPPLPAIKQKEVPITMIQIPSLTQPGQIKMNESGNIVEFYYGQDVLEATDTGAVLTEAVMAEPSNEAKFTLLTKSEKECQTYRVVNLSQYCICLSLKHSGSPQLVSILKDDIASHGSDILQYITIFESSDNKMALFFTHINQSQKLTYFYLSPHQATPSDQTPSVNIISVDVSSCSDEERIDIHRRHLYFSLTPQGEDQTDYIPMHHRLFLNPSSSTHLAHSPTHVTGNHDNGGESTLESSSESRDSGCGQSTKSSRGNSRASNGEENNKDT